MARSGSHQRAAAKLESFQGSHRPRLDLEHEVVWAAQLMHLRDIRRFVPDFASRMDSF